MLMPAALTSTRTSPTPGTGRGTSRTSRTSIPPYESNCTALLMSHHRQLQHRYQRQYVVAVPTGNETGPQHLPSPCTSSRPPCSRSAIHVKGWLGVVDEPHSPSSR